MSKAEKNILDVTCQSNLRYNCDSTTYLSVVSYEIQLTMNKNIL